MVEAFKCEMPILEQCSSEFSQKNQNDTRSNFQSCFQKFQHDCLIIAEKVNSFWQITSFILFGILIVLIGLAGFYIHNRYGSLINLKLPFINQNPKDASSINFNYKVPENPDLKLFRLENKLSDKKYLLRNYERFKSIKELPKNVKSMKQLEAEIAKLQKQVNYEKYLRNNAPWSEEYSNMNLESLLKEKKTIENQLRFYKLYYYSTPGKDLRGKGELESRVIALDKEILKHHQRNLSESKIHFVPSLKSLVEKDNPPTAKLSDFIMDNKESDINFINE